MEKKSNEDLEKLGRQPDLTPPPHKPVPPPSFLIYALLLAFAVMLLVFAFSGGSIDWADFQLNLATEILGAIIILLLVERRFRAIKPLTGIASIRRVTRVGRIPGYVAEVKGYASSLLTRAKQSSLPFYVSRPEIEAALLNYPSGGLLVVGPPRIGKTTLLLHFVRKQASRVLKAPRKAPVPVLVPVARWMEGEAVEVLRETMQDFYPVSERTFRRLLGRGRLVCLFDGIEDSLNPPQRIAALKTFQERYPQNTLIVTSSSEGAGELRKLGLQELHIPPLGKEEIEKLMRLRTRWEERPIDS